MSEASPSSTIPSQTGLQVISVDPSMTILGMAVHDEGVLECSGRIVRKAKRPGMDDPASWFIDSTAMADTVGYWILMAATHQDHVLSRFRARVLIIEMPANWMGGRGEQSKDNEAVQKLYATVGCIASHPVIRAYCSVVCWVQPGQWKGQVDKDIMLNRAVRYAGVGHKITDHNQAEAILLGRYCVERLAREVRPNGPDAVVVTDMRFQKPIISLCARCGYHSLNGRQLNDAVGNMHVMSNISRFEIEDNMWQ